MSVENVRAFFEKVEGDKGLQEKMKILAAKVRKSRDEEVAELIKIASAAGFEFTPDEIALVRSQKQEISADEFKRVQVGAGFVRTTSLTVGPFTYGSLCLCEGNLHM